MTTNDDVALDPRAAALLERLHPDPPMPGPRETGPDLVRAGYAALCSFGGPGPAVAETEDVEIAPGLAGRWYRPDGEVRGVGIWFHGGGQTIGSIETHDPVCRRFAVTAGLDVLGVEYRLAPEHPFPASIEDALTTVRFASAIAEERGLPLVVGGDSAGGNLTIAACVEAGVPIAAAVPSYPGTSANADTDSMRALGERHLLTRESIEWFWDNWIGAENRATAPARSIPALTADLSGLPPTFVLTLSHDPLRDEGEAFVARARKAGADIEHLRLDGHIHAVLNLYELFPDACDEFWSAASAFLDRVLPVSGGGGVPAG